MQVRVVSQHPNGLAQIDDDDFIIYPIPANSRITIESYLFPSYYTQICDALGRIVGEVKIIGTTTIDVTDLPDGVYYLSFINNEHRPIRFVIAR